MATTADLRALGFEPSAVVASALDIEHPDPTGLGPFCRLAVTTAAPDAPGVYAWVVDDHVRYVGRASHLIHVVHGVRFGRPFQDYTYVPASKVKQTSSPRVRINGLLNHELKRGNSITWWWRTTETVERSKRSEGELIDVWNPPWNRSRPRLA